MRILVTEPLHNSGIGLLEREFSVEVRLGMSPALLMREVRQYDALITRSGTPVTSDLLKAGKERLKVVGRAGIGVDNIDINSATAHGIAVVNAPNGNVRAAAEHTIALLFAISRNIPQAHHLLRDGVWGKNHFMGCELAGKTLGIIGLGKVGKQVARRAMGLDLDVIAYDPFVEQGPDIPLLPLDDLLRQADFVTLHVPLTPITANMIGARELDLMKESAYIINCARGLVVDEVALHEACKHGRIAGAALDVFASEPLNGSGLLELNNVIVTPHLGGTTHEAMQASALEVAEQVRAVLVGEYPAYIINPEVLAAPVANKPCTLNRWEQFRRVVFDCDSTLSEIEGVNELAAMNGVPYEVAVMTRQAMGGEVPFEEVFARRLDIIKPQREQLAAVGKLYTSTLVEDAQAVAAALTYLGVEVRLVSGGYRDALVPLARKLGVPTGNLHANDLNFNSEGDYQGYDAGNPLCRSGGKSEVLRQLNGEGATLFIGDGASDAEVSPHVELFVGYGGVEKRGQVHEVAPVYLHGESLAPLLVMAAGMEGCRKLLAQPQFRPLVVKGLSMLMQEGAADYHPDFRPFFTRLRKFCLEGICN
ncbi:MAG TPA: HAD-IB family phosphatase [Chloroflexia bacterium]|jgi:HAD superfamily phosphoserine phosphatase-like hydrolase